MCGQSDTPKAGMTVLDARAMPIGAIHAVDDDRLVLQLQQTVTVPTDAIQEVTPQTVRLDPSTTAVLPKTLEEVRPATHTGQACAACGALEGAETDRRYVRHGDAWFCPECWRGLPDVQVAQVVQAVALQGVPNS